MIVFVGAVVIGATGAFFSDTETSTGNTFTAGAIDLKIDNTSYTTNEAGQLVASPSTSWILADLTNQLFFDFLDLKPGDRGEDTISIHVDNNDAYACMDVTLTGTPENLRTEPETLVDNTAGTNEGELQNELNFAWWADDGDNVYESGESIFKQGTAASLFAVDQQKWALADAATNIWGATAGTPIPGDSTKYIAKYWCFGAMTPSPLPNDSSNGPLVRGTGFSCNGSTLGNGTQTDGVVVDVTFEAVQSRNNNEFRCNTVNCTPVNESLFADGFESGNFSAWTEDTGTWDVVNNPAIAHGGSEYALTIGDTGSIDDLLRKAVSTVSHDGVTLSYWYRITEQPLESSDHVYVEYSLNGSTWTQLAHYTNLGSTSGWVPVIIDLPANADNNANFQFRFRSDLGSNNDAMKFDDVSLSGNTICPANQ